MNTSAINQIGFLRGGMAGALMAAAITATALGAAATSHADIGAQTPGTHSTTPSAPIIDGFGNGTPGYHPTPSHCHGHCH